MNLKEALNQINKELAATTGIDPNEFEIEDEEEEEEQKSPFITGNKQEVRVLQFDNGEGWMQIGTAKPVYIQSTEMQDTISKMKSNPNYTVIIKKASSSPATAAPIKEETTSEFEKGKFKKGDRVRVAGFHPGLMTVKDMGKEQTALLTGISYFWGDAFVRFDGANSPIRVPIDSLELIA